MTKVSTLIRQMAKEGHRLASLERAAVLSASDDPKDQDKAREIRVRHDYENLRKQISSKKKPTKPAIKEGMGNIAHTKTKKGGKTIINVNKNDEADAQKAMKNDPKYILGKTRVQPYKEEVKRDEYGDPVGGPKISKKKKAKNLSSNTPDEQHTTTTSEAVGAGVPLTPQELEIQKKMSRLNVRLARKRSQEMQKAKAKDTETAPEQVKEGSLHKWFKGSKSKDGKPGWVNVKTGGTCASDEPGEGTPKCVSSAKRASMTKAERESASRRKKAADPNQQQKSGAAKPTYVKTDIKEEDKKGKGSGKKDACYHKVKASAKVWPSVYASGRLVQCRKKGAANYGNSKKESYSWRNDFDYVEEGAAWTKKAGKNPEGGLNEKGRKSYERENPGSNLKAPQPEGGSRKKSFCARMGGMKKKLTSSKTANDPNSRINKALRKWKC